ncbi:IclR family transcriptional regulator C-terminal domain-containing protein [Streptomyces sp. NPDC006512]|uniref:IclR family transcriptional regulator domain-containing protein n=1 Tax=Streptomyces sp. NPDC006512 TaxID=3154307 RepID=UPI0033ABD2C9
MTDTVCGRVFHVQRTLAFMDGPSHGPRAIAREAGLNKSTVHRILNSGLAYDVFVRDDAGKYRLGSGLVRAGVRATTYRLAEDRQRQVLYRLLGEAGGVLCAIESIAGLTTARRRTEQLVTRDTALAEAGVTRAEYLTSECSLRAGAAGRAILSGLPASAQRVVAGQDPPLPTVGPGYIQDPREFLRATADVALRGVAVSREEVRAGWCAVAAPVSWGSVTGAVVLAKLSADMSPDATEEIIYTREAAGRINQLLAEPFAA